MDIVSYFFLFLILTLSSPAFAAPEELDAQISKFEFQGVHFGDFPSVDMICIRGLCPVGEMGVGIKTGSRMLPSYNQQMTITHYNGVKISTPHFKYFDDKMCQVMFDIQCNKQGQDECIEAVKAGLDAKYGLTLLETLKNERAPLFTGEVFLTESGSLVDIIRDKGNMSQPDPYVKIYDKYLMDMARLAVNPNYVPVKIKATNSQTKPKKQISTIQKN